MLAVHEPAHLPNKLCLQWVYTTYHISVVCIEDGTAITEVRMMAVTAMVCPHPYQWLRAILLDLDGSSRDATTLQLMRTILLLAKVRSYIEPSACLSPTSCKHL